MSMDEQAFDKVWKAAKAKHDDLSRELQKSQGVISALQEICPHNWSYQGTDTRGSSKGDSHFTCLRCGLREVRG